MLVEVLHDFVGWDLQELVVFLIVVGVLISLLVLHPIAQQQRSQLHLRDHRVAYSGHRVHSHHRKHRVSYLVSGVLGVGVHVGLEAVLIVEVGGEGEVRIFGVGGTTADLGRILSERRTLTPESRILRLTLVVHRVGHLLGVQTHRRGVYLRYRRLLSCFIII